MSQRPTAEDTLEAIVVDAAAVIGIVLLAYGFFRLPLWDALRGGALGVLLAGVPRLALLLRNG